MTDENRGVNKATSDASIIKSGDTGSTITVRLQNLEGKPVRGVEWVRLVGDDGYSSVEDFETQNGDMVFMRLPVVPDGDYHLEIKDNTGRIYPAEGTLRLTLVGSTHGAKEAVYVSYKDEIVSEIPAMIGSHMQANVEAYRGVQGVPGDTVVNPPKTYTRAEYDALDDYDDNTLYIVKEA